MTVIAEALKSARASANLEYGLWSKKYTKEKQEWEELGYGKAAKPKIDSLVRLATNNWGKIATVGTAFGLPLGVADPGAFKTVLGVLGNFWPF